MHMHAHIRTYIHSKWSKIHRAMVAVQVERNALQQSVTHSIETCRLGRLNSDDQSAQALTCHICTSDVYVLQIHICISRQSLYSSDRAVGVYVGGTGTNSSPSYTRQMLYNLVTCKKTFED